MHVATVRPLGLGLGEDQDIPLTSVLTSAAFKIVQACQRPPVEQPSQTAVEIFKLLSTADQDALALAAINYGGNAQCVAQSLALARQATGAAPPSPLPAPKPDPGAPERSGITGGKVALVVSIAAATAGAIGFVLAGRRTRGVALRSHR